ncbi:MAG: chromosomal replication initiator protein DnaA [Deltaproteobacteria bacterium]|nr:chromosomal replication initiator protein DnaA [Deltaproteobacteria bacterium]
MTKTANEIWDAALGGLELQVTKANYQTWLKDTIGISCDNGCFIVGAPNTFAVEWLEKRLRHLIKKTLASVIGQPVEVQFEVCQEPQSESPRPTPTNGNGRTNHTSFSPKYTFPSFIVGSCNRLAHAAALGVAENPGTVYNPLFVYGGSGLGKTHLLHAIGQKVSQNARQVVYVTAEQFTNEFITGIREKSTEEFRNKYRSADVLLIDDIQFIAGKEQTQEGLFHTFNDLHTANRQIILSSDRPPKALSLLEDRLRSRFEWGLIVDIQPPDFETRIAILQGKAAELRVTLPHDSLHIIARKVQNNIRELEGALNRVIAYAKLTNSAITPELTISALAEIASDESRFSLTMDEVINMTGAHFGLAPEALFGKKRDKSVALARHVAMYLMREEMDASWTDIGRALGGRDHSTVLHGHQKISSEIEASSALRREILEIKESLHANGVH